MVFCQIKLFQWMSIIIVENTRIFICRRSRADLEVSFGVLVVVVDVDVVVVLEPLLLLLE